MLRPGVVRTAGVAARRLLDAAIRCDAGSVAGAARGFAGLGPGLTPSGDDLLAGFAAAWDLVGDALGVDGVARERVTDGPRRGSRARRVGARASVARTRRPGRAAGADDAIRGRRSWLRSLAISTQSCAARSLSGPRRAPTGWWASSSAPRRLVDKALRGPTMVTRGRVRPDTFVDSVALMQVTERVRALPGVRAAALVMATDLNRRLLDETDLLPAEAKRAGSADLVIAVRAESAAAAEAALGQAEGPPRRAPRRPRRASKRAAALDRRGGAAAARRQRGGGVGARGPCDRRGPSGALGRASRVPVQRRRSAGRRDRSSSGGPRHAGSS